MKTNISSTRLILLLLLLNLPPYFEYYDYDKDTALNLETMFFHETAYAKIYRVYYDSLMGGRAPAILSIPKVGKPPFPCIIFLHGYGGSKEDILDFVDLVAELGYSIFAIL